MSRLTIDRFLILWSLHGSLRCCETDRETDCTNFLSLDAQDIEREDNSNTPDTLALFNCVRVPASENLASDQNHAHRPLDL